MSELVGRITAVLREALSLDDFDGDQLYEGAIDPRELAERAAEALKPELTELAQLREYRDSAGIYVSKSTLSEWSAGLDRYQNQMVTGSDHRENIDRSPEDPT